MLAKLKAWFKHSATILVARIGAALSGGLLAVVQVADIANMREVRVQIAEFLSPKMVSLIGLGAFVIVELARRRTLHPPGSLRSPPSRQPAPEPACTGKTGRG